MIAAANAAGLSEVPQPQRKKSNIPDVASAARSISRQPANSQARQELDDEVDLGRDKSTAAANLQSVGSLGLDPRNDAGGDLHCGADRPAHRNQKGRAGMRGLVQHDTRDGHESGDGGQERTGGA